MNRHAIVATLLLAACSTQPDGTVALSPQATQFVSVLCRADAVVEPVAVMLAPLAGTEVAALAGLDQVAVHPAAQAACDAVLKGSKVVGRAVARGD